MLKQRRLTTIECISLPKRSSLRLNRDRNPLLKEFYQDQSGNKPSYMRCIRNTSGRFISTKHTHSIDQLKYEPNTNYDKSRQCNNSDQEPNPNTSAGKQKYISTQHAGYCTGGTKTG